MTAVAVPAGEVRSRTSLVVGDGCTACGACVVTCPTGALRPAPRRPRFEPLACTLCAGCVEVCPTDAVTLCAEASGG